MQTNRISGDVPTLPKFMERKILAKMFDIFVQESESNNFLLFSPFSLY
jgi:hypothetical protein